MNDALALGEKRKVRSGTEFADVAVQRSYLLFAGGVGDAVIATVPPRGGRVVVGGGHDRAHTPDLAACRPQPLKGLRAGYLMHQVAVDVKDGRSIVFRVDNVLVPELVVQRACVRL